MASLHIVIFTGWRALAGEYQLLKLDSLCFFRSGSVFLKNVANNPIVVAENATNHALELIYFDFIAQ